MPRARFVWLLLTAAGTLACGGVQPQTTAALKKLEQRLDELADAHQAQGRRIAYLKDRLDLMKDQLEATALNPRAPRVPLGLPVVRVRPPPPPDDQRPARTITQTDLDRMSPSRRASRGPVAPPANAARAGNIGVVHLPPPPLAAASGRPEAGSGGEPPKDAAVAAYKAAYRLHQRGESGRAAAAFADFVARFPQHPYADNALYWMGEARFRSAQYRGALEAFRRVLSEHPTGNKVPDALYMIGRTMNKLGRPAEGRETLARLVAMYPDTQAARSAARDISAVGGRM